MRLSNWSPCLALLALSATFAQAQQTVRSVRGVVRDTAMVPLGGVDVLLGQRQTRTDAQGVFRVDSLRPGQYVLIVRRIGYSPIRERVTVLAESPTELEYTLAPAPFLLPALVTEGRRTGIYGTVADSSYRAAVGARVQVAGFQGGEALTDSNGRFAFPRADNGAYMVRVMFPGYRERRLTLDLKRGEGRELAVRLMPGFEAASKGDEPALEDLRLRLSMGFRRERMTARELALAIARDGSRALCEIRMNAGGSPIIVVNGIDVYRNMPRSFLCFWRADQVELVEFGPDICREASRTLTFLVNEGCTSSTRSAPRSIRGGGRRASAGSGRGYIVIWEKR